MLQPKQQAHQRVSFKSLSFYKTKPSGRDFRMSLWKSKSMSHSNFVTWGNPVSIYVITVGFENALWFKC